MYVYGSEPYAGERRSVEKIWRRLDERAGRARRQAADWVVGGSDEQATKKATVDSGEASRLVQVCETRGKNRAGRLAVWLGNRLCGSACLGFGTGIRPRSVRATQFHR